ncbi:hypothetical protein [Micromonospora sp. NPDC005324]|uniref:hypothetical protein n=1 Tax=Micromonospora sp. NPDC005324 TaxID=3157033 RepID=UPI0033A8954D
MHIENASPAAVTGYHSLGRTTASPPQATAFEDYVEAIAYINIDVDDPTRVRIYPMTMQEALRIEQEQT